MPGSCWWQGAGSRDICSSFAEQSHVLRRKSSLWVGAGRGEGGSISRSAELPRPEPPSPGLPSTGAGMDGGEPLSSPHRLSRPAHRGEVTVLINLG